MFDNNKILNLLISTIPLSLICGNLITNINIILICFVGLINFKSKIFFIKNKINQILLYFFFFFLIITTFFNNLPHFDENSLYLKNLYKSIFFIRYLFLFLIISKLIENNNFNVKLFFYSSAFFSSIIALDVLMQIAISKELIYLKNYVYKPSALFGSEKIAGSYLQKFVLFFIFLIMLRKQEYEKKNLLILFLFIIFLIPILISGNRMPVFIYSASILIYYITEKKFKEIIFFSLSLVILIFALLKFPIVDRIDTRIKTFVKDTKELIIKAPKLFYYNNYNNEIVWFGHSGYLIHFNSGVQIWKKNKYMGNGLKSFPLNCVYENNQTCNNHPHNYFIEIMMDTGLIGLISIYLLFGINFLKITKHYFYIKDKTFKLISFPFYIIIFFEFFPFRSSGSFFTTNNAVIIFLFLSIFINLKKIKNNYK